MRNNGYGVGGQFLVRLGDSPLLLGVDAGYINTTRERLCVFRCIVFANVMTVQVGVTFRF